MSVDVCRHGASRFVLRDIFGNPFAVAYLGPQQTIELIESLRAKLDRNEAFDDCQLRTVGHG